VVPFQETNHRRCYTRRTVLLSAVHRDKLTNMPTVLRNGPYRFFFYAGDGGEPAHVHVERDDCEAKFWLDPVELERSFGYKRNEINRIRALVEVHREELLEGWDEFFRG
jgi:hypothetical protein